MTDPLQEDLDFLAHYGKKGMKWGTRREVRKASDKELKDLKNSFKAGEKAAKKDPTFKREVKATRKREGISGIKNFAKTEKYGRLSSRAKGDFKNSKGEKVSEDFANAVLNKATAKTPAQKIVLGAKVAGIMLVGVGGLSVSKIR